MCRATAGRHCQAVRRSIRSVKAGTAGYWAFGRAACISAVLLFAGCSGFIARDAEWQTVTMGLCEDYPEESRSLEKARSDLAHARHVGARVLRVSFGWDAMEPTRGVYDWTFWDDFVRLATEEYGLRLIPYVCYTPKWAAEDAGENSWRSPPKDPADFARFMSALVARYRHAIRSWELWNEPDNPAYWLGTVEAFAALVRAGSVAVRQADPTAQVVLGGIATELGFLERLFRVQRIASAVDVVNLHNYYETWHPEAIERLPDYIEDAAEIVRRYGEREPLWLAEAGYSSVGPRAKVSDVYRSHWSGEHTEDAQAAALVRIHLLGFGTRALSLIAWYRINDLERAQEVIGDDNNRHLGVRRSSGATKPATQSFAQLAQLFTQPFRVVSLPFKVLEREGADVVVRAFELRDGRHVVAAWMANTRPVQADATSGPAADVRRAVVQVDLPFVARIATLTDASGRSVAKNSAMSGTASEGRKLTLQLRAGDVVMCTVKK
jgi:hypothetical protein